jgi:16S rRNA (uracil1498-N3)-methyltransferase
MLLDHPLSAGAQCPLTEDQARHLRLVLRLQPGDEVLAFNGRDGEWRGRFVVVGKRGAAVTLGAQTRLPDPDATAGPVLLFAPLKRQATDWVVEKATELGAARLVPVLTRRTIAETVRLDRLAAIAADAAAQCGRLDAPILEAPQLLDVALSQWPKDRPLWFADEAGGRRLAEITPRAGRLAPGLLVGPEGGFEDQERAFLTAMAQVQAFSLGPRILRAETACVAGLALVQSYWTSIGAASCP